jgi:hypothetical protein
MTDQIPTVAPARTIRFLHGAMVSGVLLFALVGHFVLRPTMMSSGALSESVIRALLGVSLGGAALSFLLRKRVPIRSTQDATDLFWTTATTPAMILWACLEAGSLLAIVVYAFTGRPAALAVAAVSVILLVVLNPAHLERRP